MCNRTILNGRVPFSDPLHYDQERIRLVDSCTKLRPHDVQADASASERKRYIHDGPEYEA